jgi:hypothetical protein
MTHSASSASEIPIRIAAVAICGIVLALGSCSQSPAPETASTPAPVKPLPQVDETAPPAVAPAVTPTASTSPSSEGKGSDSPSLVKSDPQLQATTTTAVPTLPRANLFAPPEMDTGVTQLPPEAALTENRVAVDVALKGFARLGDAEQGEPRVVLLIGDRILPLTAGQERDGVRVISIAPPQVTLERGGEQWNLSMEARKPAAEPDASQPR